MERNRGLDLLRLFAGMAVVMLHYNYAYAFNVIDSIPTENRLFLYFMESLSAPAVNVFLLISGYFLYRSENRSLGKALNLLLLVVIFNELYYLGITALGKTSFGWGKIFLYLAPNQYFIVLYCAVYIISPYINKILTQLSDKGLMRFILILTIVICIEPWFVDEIELISGSKINGLSMISHWGGGSGHTLVFFIYMYILGASLNRFNLIPNRISSKCGLFVSSTLAVFLSFVKLKSYVDFSYYNPFIILQSISLFYLFKDINCSKFVSKLSKAALACYIIHYNLLYFLKIEYFVRQPLYVLVMHVFFSIMGLYLLSFVYMTVYDFVFKKPVEKLNKLNIDYFFDDGNSTNN